MTSPRPPSLSAACLRWPRGALRARRLRRVFLEDLTWPELQRDIARGQDDDHRPHRRHRAERPAHGAGQAQRARAGAGREDRARTRQRAGRAGRSPTCPRAASTRRPAHMRFPGTITVPDDDVRAGARVRRAQLQAARLSRHRVPRRPRRLPEGPAGRRRPAESRMGGHARPRRTRSSSTTARPPTAYVDALKSRGYSATTRSARTPALADTSLTLALDSGLVRSDVLAQGAQAAAADGVSRRSAPRQRRSSGQLGVDAIVAATVAAIRKATARR